MSSYKDIFTNLLVKTHFVEEKDEREYDYEGDMAKSQLKSIITNAQRLHDMLEDDTNLPEWVQSKITLAEDYVLTVANYMEGEEDLDEEVEQIDEVGDTAKGRAALGSYVKKKHDQFYHNRMMVKTQGDLDRLRKDANKNLARAEKRLDPKGPFANSKSIKSEEVEQIDELKKSTLASYVKGATRDVASASRLQRGYETDAIRSEFPPVQRGSEFAAKTMRKIAGKRSRGIARAVDKLAKEEFELDEAQKKLKPTYWRAEWRLGTETEVDKNNKKIYDKLAKTDPVKASAFHDNLMRMKKKDMKEEVEEVEEGAKDWKKAFSSVAQKNLHQDTKKMKYKVRRRNLVGLQPKVDMTPKVTAAVSKKGSTKVDEEVTYFSGTTVSGKAWKFIPPAEPKMLSPEFVKDRVPTLTDKEAHEVSVVAKDQYDDVAKKFAEMSEAKAGTVPKTPKEKELAAKAHPKHLITRKDVLHARGVKLGEAELREKIREKLGAPGKTMTKKPADPVIFHPLGKKKK